MKSPGLKLLPRTDLAPVYSFNGSGLWKSRERGRGDLLGKAVDLDLWANLLSRLPPEYLNFPDADLADSNNPSNQAVQYVSL